MRNLVCFYQGKIMSCNYSRRRFADDRVLAFVVSFDSNGCFVRKWEVKFRFNE